MSMKVKGLLKGLRYISTIFDEEEEQEMQIGFPTDVKHVAHIGWEGPASNSPSWINKFKDGDPEGGGGGGGVPSNGDQQIAPKPRDPRLSTGSDTPSLESPSRRRSDKSKASRRANAAASAGDSPKKSSSSEHRTKQQQQQTLGPEGDPASSAGPKPSTRRKKPKSGSTSGQSSSRASTRSKPTGPSTDFPHFSDPGTGGKHSSNSNSPIGTALGSDQSQTPGRRTKGKDTCQSSLLKVSSEQDDQKSLDDISRGIHAM